VTVTVTTTDAALGARVAALEQQYAVLAARVTAIEDANAASWQAFHDAIVAGETPEAAALTARSAGMNAIYMIS
jgi:hypothetical protein